ncbi:MAG: TatD family hydrolase [Endomicrobium sp.]|jgi:TatD DNase family protein|nr:TatD family hydrolase [Endomicrobium sp.]
MIIDTHVHLSDAKFDADRDETVKRAFDSGVTVLFEISCDPLEWDKALEFSKRDNVYISFGIHPHEAEKAKEEDFFKLESLIDGKKTIAVGEIGLDYHYDFSPRHIQREVFIRQLGIAAKHNKPVIIHCRSAYEEMITLLKKYENPPKGVIHCFSGTIDEAKVFAEMGFLLGICGPVTYPKSDKLKQVASEIPIEKLLIETDCPYLAPQKYRGQRNEPAYVTEVLRQTAELKNISFEEAARITANNAKELFLQPS